MEVYSKNHKYDNEIAHLSCCSLHQIQKICNKNNIEVWQKDSASYKIGHFILEDRFAKNIAEIGFVENNKNIESWCFIKMEDTSLFLSIIKKYKSFW